MGRRALEEVCRGRERRRFRRQRSDGWEAGVRTLLWWHISIQSRRVGLLPRRLEDIGYSARDPNAVANR